RFVPTAQGEGHLASAIGNAAFLVVSAPYRWGIGWTTAAIGTTPGLGVPSIFSIAFIALSFTVPQPLRRVVWTLLALATALVAAVGYGRAENTWDDLYHVDRYYYWYGPPFAIVTVAIVHAIVRNRASRAGMLALIVIAVGLALVQARRNLDP